MGRELGNLLAEAQSDRESASVQQVSQANGFYQLGRFAVEHKALFGESPSVTLSRQPEVADRDLLRAHGSRQR